MEYLQTQKENKEELELAHGSHLGFFGKVFRGDRKIIKRYRGYISLLEFEKLKVQHENFVNNLRNIGIFIPQTEFRFIGSNKKLLIEIEQEEFFKNELAGEIIKYGSKEEVLFVFAGIINDALCFIKSPLYQKMGFHPTIRNYAVRDKVFYMLDTFPPYSDRRTTELLMLRHAPSFGIKLVMILAPFFLHKFSEEYYHDIEMLYGIYATTARLRPELEVDIRSALFNLCSSDKGLLLGIKNKIGKDGYKQKNRWHFVNKLKRIFPKSVRV